MRLRLALSATALLALALAPAAQALECPATAAPADAAQAKAIAATLGGGAALDDMGWLADSISSLEGRGIARTAIVDALIGGYCRQVEAEAGQTEAEKTALLRSFAARVTQIAYAGGEESAVVLAVPVPPATLKKIDERARAAGQSPEAWVAEMVESALD